MAIRTIKIIPREVTAKNGNKFTAYKAVKKDGGLIDAKFTKAVGDIPDDVCEITVKDGNYNIDKNREFPVLWVKEVESFKTRSERYLDVEVDDEDCPFLK